jgi:hypothetical protein
MSDIPHVIDLDTKPKWNHEMFVGPGIDAAKVREDAHRLQRGDFYKGSESVLVHFHRHDEPCEDHDHTEYKTNDGK